MQKNLGKIKRTVEEYVVLTVATLILVVGVYVFKFPNNFSFGGVTGLAVVLPPVLSRWIILCSSPVYMSGVKISRYSPGFTESSSSELELSTCLSSVTATIPFISNVNPVNSE